MRAVSVAWQMVWVDIGGGTARNLEFFALKTLRQFFSQIYVVDVSRSMLEVLKRAAILL